MRKFDNLYYSSNIIETAISSRMKLVWHGREVKCTENFGGRPEGKNPLRRPKRRWEDSINMDLKEIGGDMNWIYLARDRDHRGGSCEHGDELLFFIKY
jgi:hypothetical protein